MIFVIYSRFLSNKPKNIHIDGHKCLNQISQNVANCRSFFFSRANSGLLRPLSSFCMNQLYTLMICDTVVSSRTISAPEEVGSAVTACALYCADRAFGMIGMLITSLCTCHHTLTCAITRDGLKVLYYTTACWWRSKSDHTNLPILDC